MDKLYAINAIKKFDAPINLSQGETFRFRFDKEIESHKNYKLNVVGEVAIDYFLRYEGVLPFYYRKLDDSITFIDGKKVLLFNKRNQVEERALYTMIKGVGKGEYTLSIVSKIKNLNCPFTVSAEIYYGRENTRYYYETADKIVKLELRETTGFIDNTIRFKIDNETAFIMIKIDATNFIGDAVIFSPKLLYNGINVCPEFDYCPDNIKDFKWIGEGFSYFERPKYTIKVNGKVLYDGIIMDRLERYAGFSINVPSCFLNDKNEFEIYYASDNVKPYTIKEIRLINAPTGFDFLGVKRQLEKDKPFSVFVYSETDDVSVEKSEFFDYLGSSRVYGNYCLLHFIAKQCGNNVVIKVHDKEITVEKIVDKLEDKIITGTGDFIYISQNIDEFSEYLSWYLTENIGNLLTFRCVYHWSGDNVINSEFWRVAEELLSDLGIYFSMMRDGRELNGVNVTPPDGFFTTKYYLGSQTHERDGAYTYWDQTINSVDETYYNVLSRKIKYNGIYGKRSPVYDENGKPYLYYVPNGAKTVKDAYEKLKENLKLTAIDGATRHTGTSMFFRTFFEAGYKWVGYESMYGAHELFLGAIRGACKSFNLDNFGTHLALQWSTIPADDEKHFIRYGLSLYLSYMHGATEINTEEGLWRIENAYSDFDRYSYACTGHAAWQTKFNNFINSHIRRGKLKTEIAMLIGNYDGMDGFSSPCLFGQAKWAYSTPEKSWDLVKVFYPESDINAIYYYITKGGKLNVSEKDKKLMTVRKGLYRDVIDYKQVGFYTNTPYGVIDILPVSSNNYNDYKFLFFTGFNVMDEEQLKKLCVFCDNGGVLLMAKPHLFNTVNREDALNGTAQIIDSPLVDRLLSYVKTGNLIYFNNNAYPFEYRKDYEKAIINNAERFSNKCISDTERLSYTEYVTEDNTHVFYLLNIDWWDNRSARYKIRLGNNVYDQELSGNDIRILVIKDDVAVYADNLFIDIERVSENQVLLLGNGKTNIYILHKGIIKEYSVNVSQRAEINF